MALFNREEMNRISQEKFGRNYDRLTNEQQEEVDDERNNDEIITGKRKLVMIDKNAYLRQIKKLAK